MAKMYYTGDVIGGLVKIRKYIGEGGQAITYEAERLADGVTVFVKQLKADLRSERDATAVKRFQREQEIDLDCPLIPEVLGSVTHEGACFLLFEYVDGQSLENYLNTQPGPLPNDQIRYIGQGVATAAAAAHSKCVIHRDIKPANVMLARDGRVMTVDFGLCTCTDSRTLLATGEICGTPHSMSPEQIKNSGVDKQTDLWALGVLMYTCATQQYPFDGATEEDIFRAALNEKPIPPSEINPSLDRDLELIILRLLEKEKTKRYDTAEALLEDLVAGYGKSLPALKCGTCGIELTPGSRFCTSCGSSLTAEEEPYEAQLRLLNGVFSGRSLIISPSGTDIGRRLLGPDDDFVSRAHARIFFEGGRYWVTDLGSMNGTAVNGVAVSARDRHPISLGDRIRFADTVCEFNR